jgi:aminobenzoyl-glutamate transport protein
MTQRLLDVVERVGNKIPHPVLIFLYLIAVVVVVSHILYLTGASVSHEVIVPVAREVGPATPLDAGVYDAEAAVTYQVIDEQTARVETRTERARSLLSSEGIRFVYTRLIPSFMGFSAMGLMIVAMMGVGVAEESGLVKALIRKLVIVSPRWALTYILVFVGITSSIASNAGYMVLIPLAGAALLSVGRHPLAGLAMGFAAVGGAFTVNMLIKPLDAVLVEFTNDAIQLVNPGVSIGLASNLWFSVASVAFLTVFIGLMSERVIEPRLGVYQPVLSGGEQSGDAEAAREDGGFSADESRGLRYALFALVGALVLFGLLAFPPGAPLRDPATGALVGNTPFMNGLIAVVMVVFLATGAAYGLGARTMKSTTDVIKAVEKTVTGMGGLIVLFFVLSQFVAYFSYSNIGTMLAVSLANVLREANAGPFWLLLGFIVVVVFIDLFITGAAAK